jgi:hypothetical protein
MPVWSNTSEVVHNIYCELGSGQQETSGQNLRIKTKINNNYNTHKTQWLNYQIFFLNLNTIKNIGGGKILAPTKYTVDRNYWRQQNIDVDKISPLTKYPRWQNIGDVKILTSTKYQSWQNIDVYKILTLTKYCHRQKIAVDKISPSTKYRQRQNIDVDKISTLTKYCRWQNIDLDVTNLSTATK